MSLSKKKMMDFAAMQPRLRNCTRCGHHGIITPQKGHKKMCPFLRCICCMCSLVAERNRITNLQRSLRMAHSKDPPPPHLSTDGAQSPWDLRCGARRSGDVQTSNAPCIGELGQPVHLPLIHFRIRMMGHIPSSYAPFPNVMINVPRLPPVSAGLHGTPNILYLPQSAVHYPPSSEAAPPAESRQDVNNLQPPPLPQEFQEEQTQGQHPQSPPAEPDIV